MTKTFLAAVFAGLALAACEQKPTATEAVPPPNVPTLAEAQKATSPPPPPVEARPAPAPVAEVAPPPAKPTVGSTVWTVARVSITTDDGIIALPPGTKLRVARETETGYVVTDGKQEFAVGANQVALDSTAATSATASDAAARSAELAWQKAQQTARSKNAQTALANQALGELQNRYDLLAREEASLQAGLQRARAEDLQSYNAASQRRVFTRSVSTAQAAAWKARLPIVQLEKERASYELRKARQ
jgi:hypothetical protein